MDERRTVVADCDGDNLNVSNGKLYFTSFENKQAQIKAVDLESGAVSTVLSTGNDEIRSFYVVNDDTMMYLTDGVVYSCRIGDQKAERISPMDNVFGFLPTYSGNLYATGKLCDYSVFLEDVHLLDNASSYYVDMEKDHFIATVDGVLLQIPMAQLREFCSTASMKRYEKTGNLLPYMTEYDLYGTFDAAEVLRLDDEDRECEHCEQAARIAQSTQADDRSLGTAPEIVETYAATWTSNVSKMIMKLSNTMTTCAWTPKKDVRKYNSQKELSDAYFKAGTTVIGIPYARTGVFKNFAPALKDYMKYIVYGASNPAENASGNLSLAGFQYKVSHPETATKFYGAAANIAPLYGTDCSGFVAYCWGVPVKLGTSHYGGGVPNDPKDSSKGVTYYCTKLGSVNSSVSSLKNLQVGDAFVTTTGDSHAILISKITYGSNGNVTKLEVTEETPPKTQTTPWSASSFVNEYIKNGYIAYRTKSYKVTFNGNGGSPSISSMNVLANVPYSYGNGLPDATRSGYKFLGWYTAKTGGTEVKDSSSSGTANRTLYAHYKYTGNSSPMSQDDQSAPQAEHRNDINNK